MPCIPSRRAAIYAAVEAHNRSPSWREATAALPPCCWRSCSPTPTPAVSSQQTLRAEGFGNNVARVLRALVEAGLLSRQQSVAAPDRHKPGSGPYTYRLHLPADADVGA